MNQLQPTPYEVLLNCETQIASQRELVYVQRPSISVMKMPTGEHALKERNRSSLSLSSALTAASCVACRFISAF